MHPPGSIRSVLLACLVAAPLAAQQPRSPSDSADMLNSLAGASAEQGTPAGLRRAAALWLEAVPLAEQAGRLRLAANLLAAAGDAAWQAGDQRAALDLLPQAVERFLAVGDSLPAAENSIYLGVCQYELHQLSDARVSLQRGLRLAQAVHDGAQVARALYQLVLIEATEGDPDSVPGLTQAAYAAFAAVGDSQMVARVWLEVGIVAIKRPAPALAALLLREQLRHPEGLDSVSLTFSWASLSTLRRGPGAADSSIRDLQQAMLALPSSAASTERAALLALLGHALRRAHKPREAVTALEEAARLFAAAHQWSPASQALGGLAVARADLGDFTGAQALLERLATEAESRGDTVSWVAALGRQVDLLAVPLNSPRLAFERLRRALELARASHATAEADVIVQGLTALGPVAGVTAEVQQFLFDDTRNQTGLGHLRDAAVDLYWLARMFMLEPAGEDSTRTPATVSMLQLADRFAAEAQDPPLRGRVRGLLAEVLVHAGLADSARMIADLALATVRGEGGEVEVQGWLALGAALRALGQVDSALVLIRRGQTIARQHGEYSSERHAAELLADALRGRRTQASLRQAVLVYDSLAGLQESFFADETVRRAMGLHSTALFGVEFGVVMAWLDQAPTIGIDAAARGALLALERTRGLVIRQMSAGAGPRLTTEAALTRLRARHAAVFLTVWRPADVGTRMQDTLVTLVVDTGGRVHASVQVVAKDSLALMLNGTRELCCANAADSTRSGAAGTGTAGLRSTRRGALRQLSTILLQPAVLSHLRGADEVLVETDLLLSIALFSAAPIGPDSIPFGVRYAFRYVPSLSMGVERGRPAAGSPAIVLGDPVMPEVRAPDGAPRRLPQLPGALAEARWVAGRLGASLLSGPEATETEVRRRLPGSTVVHLATHGLAYRSLAEPRAPFVALAPDSINDGLLSSRELQDDPALRLQAQLVVLSACQSGLGEPSGEGLNGLQRAFLARGAHSVLYSLWNVSDEATAQFMERFYRHWLDDRDKPGKSEALRRARVDLRADARFRAPRFWAAFQLAGED